MRFKVGDRVTVLDDDISGVVHKVLKNEVVIQTEDGFLLSFDASELLINPNNDVMARNIQNVSKMANFIEGKERKSSITKKKTTKKDRAQPAMEVDLHIHQLVNSSKGMTNYDMLNLQLSTAKRKLEFAIAKRIQRIVFIHGVGEGVLKLELETLFRRYDNIKYYDASYQKYGLGATEVYIYQNRI